MASGGGQTFRQKSGTNFETQDDGVPH